MLPLVVKKKKKKKKKARWPREGEGGLSCELQRGTKSGRKKKKKFFFSTPGIEIVMPGGDRLFGVFALRHCPSISPSATERGSVLLPPPEEVGQQTRPQHFRAPRDERCISARRLVPSDRKPTCQTEAVTAFDRRKLASPSLLRRASGRALAHFQQAQLLGLDSRLPADPPDPHQAAASCATALQPPEQSAPARHHRGSTICTGQAFAASCKRQTGLSAGLHPSNNLL